jgi:hypothetical protein
MAAHQVGGKFALWQDLWRKVDQAKSPSTAIDALASYERSSFLKSIERCRY